MAYNSSFNRYNRYQNRNRAVPKMYDLRTVLSAAITRLEVSGVYVSKPDAQAKGILSTADEVADQLASGHAEPLHHQPQINETINFFLNANPDTSFVTTCAALAASQTVPETQLGFAVAMVPYVQRSKEHQAQRAAKKEQDKAEYANSEYIGEVGKRAEFYLKLIEQKFLPTLNCNLYRFIDENKNLVVMFGGNLTEANVEVNDCILVAASVKRHDASRYNGNKETTINRVKILANDGSVDRPKNWTAPKKGAAA